MWYALKDISVRDSADRLDSFCLCVQWHWFSQRGLFFSKNCQRNKTDTCSNLKFHWNWNLIYHCPMKCHFLHSILVRQQFQGNDHEFQLMLFLRFLRVLWIIWLPQPPCLLKGKISLISYTIKTQPFIDLPVFVKVARLDFLGLIPTQFEH